MKKSYRIIFEDPDIVVIDKRAHVLSVEDRFDPLRPNLKTFLKNRFGVIYVVHRLDMETSGVMIFAKNEKSHAHLCDQFQNHTVEKIYHAIVQRPISNEGVIDMAIAEHKSKKGTYKAAKKGKSAYTKYKVLRILDQYALVELNIKTGRTHQIRVHMKHIGAPLITDSKYGISEAFFLSQIKKIRIKKDQIENPLLSRSSLHSFQLSITHPKTDERLTFTSPLHKDMKAVVFQLEKLQTAQKRRI